MGKAKSCRAPNLGFRGAESPGWFDVSPKNSACALLWWSCQWPATHSCGLLNHLNCFRRGMFKRNTKFDADLLLYSLSHFECHGHTVHMLTQQRLPPHCLVQWSHHCSHMRMPVLSPWLPGYIYVTQTVLLILTRLDFFWTDLVYSQSCHGQDTDSHTKAPKCSGAVIPAKERAGRMKPVQSTNTAGQQNVRKPLLSC